MPGGALGPDGGAVPLVPIEPRPPITVPPSVLGGRKASNVKNRDHPKENVLSNAQAGDIHVVHSQLGNSRSRMQNPP